MDELERMARLRSRTFRWAESDDTTGYHAAEVVGGHVRWLHWSHIQGEGPRELGEQTLEGLEREGPPLRVPAGVLAQIREAMQPPR
ncbi:MAG: hypothetical protein U0353_11380 [Sandaracinus sp.]